MTTPWRYDAAMRPFVAFTFASLLLSCSSGESIPTTCAGHEELCEKRFDQVAFPATHNAMADTDSNIFAACQTHDVATQLEDGIRGFMLDLYTDPTEPGVVYTCHALCQRQNHPLVAVLEAMVSHMKSHRDSILTIVLENYVSAADIDASVREARADRYLYAHTKGAPWPTLREMIDANTRLVILTDDEGGTETGAYPWLMDQWQYAFQNPYAAEQDSDFSCDVDRGTDAPNSLFVMNHFLTAPVASLSLATMVNPYASLHPHVSRCVTERGRIPNLVTVDFYDVGDVIWVVDELNGFVSGPPP